MNSCEIYLAFNATLKLLAYLSLRSCEILSLFAYQHVVMCIGWADMSCVKDLCKEQEPNVVYFAVAQISRVFKVRINTRKTTFKSCRNRIADTG